MRHDAYPMEGHWKFRGPWWGRGGGGALNVKNTLCEGYLGSGYFWDNTTKLFA